MKMPTKNHSVAATLAAAVVAFFCISSRTIPVRAESTPTYSIDFARDIQPILASKCVRCHGPETAESGLRLNGREAAIAPVDSGARAIVPGKPDDSELLRRVSADEGERMPPDGEPLTEQEINTLRQWIAAGANWPDHWAYQPLKLPKPPAIENAKLAAWARTPIDQFVLRTLVDRGLSPAPPADRRTLIRRLYFDLIGLPPLPEEVDAFLADNSPDAYERLVDRLLASPQYGERWARHWMDVVHYADSHGFEHDLPRDSWPYRDYLIKSFNSDKPYAQFIREQVAGDAVDPDNPEALAATGFLATGPWDQSTLQAGQMDTNDYRLGQYLDRDDIISTVMSTFVSSTVHCARCHDHKFDPISQADYYSLQAIFAGIDKATRTYDPDPAVSHSRKSLLAERATIHERRDAMDPVLLAPELQTELARWQQEQLMPESDWHVLEPIEQHSANGAELVKQPDLSLLSGGNLPDKDVYTVVFHPKVEKITAMRLELLPDKSLPQYGPGRQGNGNVHINELFVRAAPLSDPGAAKEVPLSRPQADFNQTGWSVGDALDRVVQTAWAIYPAVGQAHAAVFEIAEPISIAGPIALSIELHQSEGRGHLIGRFRLSVTERPLPLPANTSTLPAAISSALATPETQRSDEQKTQLAAFYLEHRVEEQLAALPQERPLYCGTNRFQPKGSFFPAEKPRPVHVLARGEIDKPSAVAQPAALRLVRELPGELNIGNVEDESARRAALANWLADERNVLTWRSIANRVWQFHFGQGLVTTPNDFGHMGTAPTHPELLDWLAATLRDNGGSLKALHRLIVTSAVYRQSSENSPEAAKIDAGNRYLWRMNRRRLDADAIHDAVLRLSGKLNLEMGGPPVKQFREIKAFALRPEADYQNFDADDPANNRRSIYRFMFRTIPDPFMSALDCPDGSALVPVRNVSITALQALAMLNDKLVIRQSQHIADQIAAHEGDTQSQVTQLYRLVLNRDPAAKELAAVTQYATRHGLANACRYLLNTNEFVFVD